MLSRSGDSLEVSRADEMGRRSQSGPNQLAENQRIFTVRGSYCTILTLAPPYLLALCLTYARSTSLSLALPCTNLLQVLAPNPEISKEVSQFEAFKASQWAKDLGLRPYRTELCVGWRAGGRSVSAGQIDALYVDKAGLYYLVDFKRVESKNILDPTKVATKRGFNGACGLAPIDHVPDTHYQHYSLQTSISNLMLHDTHGIDVGERMFLVRMYSDRAQFERVPCADLRAEAKLLLDAEASRLAAAPQPTQATANLAAQPATDATSPAPTAPSGSPAQDGSGARKRPVGAAPKGKVWQDGAWVDLRQAKRVCTPATAPSLKLRPKGQVPRGKMCDAMLGCWVERKRGFGQQSSPPTSTEDQNMPPQSHAARNTRCRTR